ncbi:MAG: hypothetical protein ACYCV7_01755, partial [Acidimicrobiales bacterium]
LNPVHGVHAAPITVEEEYFPPPPELRDILRALETAVAFLTAAPCSKKAAADAGTTVLSGDRSIGAADVLEELAG